MGKNLEISILLDFYGGILTEKQYSMIDFYYNMDLSLAEIAQNEKITRQGVRDIIKRGEIQMIELDKKLKLIDKDQITSRNLERIIESSDKIIEFNMRYNGSRDINDCAADIKVAANEIHCIN